MARRFLNVRSFACAAYTLCVARSPPLTAFSNSWYCASSTFIHSSLHRAPSRTVRQSQPRKNVRIMHKCPCERQDRSTFGHFCHDELTGCLHVLQHSHPGGKRLHSESFHIRVSKHTRQGETSPILRTITLVLSLPFELQSVANLNKLHQGR